MVQINVGASANDNTGDTLRAAFQKVNANTTELGVSITTSSDSSFNGVMVGEGGGSLNNIVVGKLSLLNNTTGISNIAIGSQSLDSNTTGGENVSIGFSTMLNNISGTNNVAIGYQALQLSNATSQNTIIGDRSGRNLSGSNNTFLGSSSGYAVYSKINNTFIGKGAGYGSNYNNCSVLGANVDTTGDNQVQLGDSATTTYVYGTVQNRSDLRDKADVQDTILGLDFISKLRPVDYRWDMRESYKSELPEQGELSDEDFKVVMDAWLIDNKLSNLKQDGTKKRSRFHHGFIAQEVKDLGFGGFQDHLVNGGEDVLSIGYDEFIAPMVKAIQELKAEIELLKAK